MRGFAGFLIILSLAVFAGLVESSFNQTMRTIFQGIAKNKLLIVFVVWYIGGFILNLFLRAGGLDDWRLMLSPVVILIGLFYSLGFMDDDASFRSFQIAFILVVGIQSFFSVQVLSQTVNIARQMWLETSGAWIYGNQDIFAAYAMLIPILLWRSFHESGRVRFVLILSCLFILGTTALSSFGTPLALMILSGLVVLLLSVFLLRRNSSIVVLLALLLPTAAIAGYQYTHENPLFYQAYSRIENFIQDPQSGGYAGESLSASRWYLAEISIKTFQSEPLVGMGGPREYNPFIGGHSSLFDSLAIYGVLGGGGAICGIILIVLAKATRRFWHERNWEALLALTGILLLAGVGLADPYWEKLLPIAIIMARPLHVGTEPTKLN